MLICDICDNEIKHITAVYRVPGEYTVSGVSEICKQCNQKISIASDKINRDSTRVRRDDKRAMIQALKDSQGNL